MKFAGMVGYETLSENMLSAMQQGYKNKEKMDMFKLMYGLYSDDLDIRRDELKNRRGV